MFLIRGIEFSYEAVRDWEAKLTPTLIDNLRRRRKGRIGKSWYVDETYIKVNGRWRYLYRAIDRSGALVNVRLSEKQGNRTSKSLDRRIAACPIRAWSTLPIGVRNTPWESALDHYWLRVSDFADP
jgi:transposase-like protein